MILIVEGPDLSGKSSAIEKISKFYNSGFVLKNAFKPRSLEDTPKIYAQYWNILNIVDNQEGVIILDRFFPSQAVYSYLRGEDHMSYHEILRLDKFCKNKNILYIYLDTTMPQLEKRYDERGDEHITKDMLTVIKNRYEDFYDQTSMKKIRINTMNKNWLSILQLWVEEQQ